MTATMPFDPPAGPVTPEQLRDIAKAVAGRPEVWTDDLRRTDRERTYVDVHTSDHLGVWAISWMADGHDTGYHDHEASRGAVVVVEGAIRHERLRLADEPEGTVVRTGEPFCFDETFIHRMRRKPGAGRTVTVHTYSPPLTRSGQYSASESGQLRRPATAAGEQLTPKGPQGEPAGPGAWAGSGDSDEYGVRPTVRHGLLDRARARRRRTQ